MRNKSILLKLILFSAWLVLSFACGSPNQTGGNSSNGAANNTNTVQNAAANNATAAISKRDPKTVCGYLTAFNPGEYKISSGDKYTCNNTNPAKTVAGRPQNFGYSASGNADTIEEVSISALTSSKYADAGEADEGVAKYGEELWQKIFNAPPPNDIKTEILNNKGKAVETSKTFTEPVNATISRNPMNAGTYTVRFSFTLPK